MFLKKNNLIFFFVFILLFFNKISLGNEIKLPKIIKYLNSLDNFSATFLQSFDNEISEGKLFIGSKRVRLDYFYPSKILIILDEDKAMYYNYDLNEDEFFNPKNTSAWFFFEIFKSSDFFLDSAINLKNKNIIINKKGYLENNSYDLSIILENDPIVLRKIKLNFENSAYIISIFNHKFDEEYGTKFFKLINPDLLN